MAGDPFSVGTGEGLFQTVDARLHTGAGELELKRFYVSSDATWNSEGLIKVGTARVPTPFGRVSSDTSIQWWHSLFSFVASGSDTFVWRGPTGRSKWFNACSINGCRAQPGPGEHNVEEQLYKTANGFDVVLADGTKLQYESKERSHSVTLHFLTRALAPNGGTLYSLIYENSSGCSAASGSDTGVPYLRRIQAPTSQGGDLQLTYTALTGQNGGTECVLTAVHARDGAGNATLVASYAYPSNVAGLISEASVLGSPTEAYSYSGTSMTVTKAGETAVSHTLSSSLVTAENNPRENLTVTRTANSPACATCCGNATTKTVAIADSDVQQGNATGTATLTRTYRVSEDATQHALPYVYEAVDSCEGSSVASRNVCSAGTEFWDWKCASASVQGHQSAHMNKKGSWEIWEKRGLPDGGPLLELVKHMRGATDDGGTNALATTNFTYAYGTSGQQLVKTEVEASGYLEGQSVTKTLAYDSTTNRLKSVIITGKTQTFSA